MVFSHSHKKEFLTCLTHSYTRLWIHLIWETLNREPISINERATRASLFLTEYAFEKGIYVKIYYFNAEHTHALIDLPTRYSIEEVVKMKRYGLEWRSEKNH